MQVTFIGHSGFLVETEGSYYLFDYYQGTLPTLNPDKPVVVLVSHGHRDHYNPEALSLLEEQGMKRIDLVLSSDIPAAKRPAGRPCLVVSPGETHTLAQGQTLTTYDSTDMGASFLLRDGEDWFFHAGDLNDWVWEGEPEEDNRQMTQAYRGEIDRLARDLSGRPLDAAFVVLDPRQEGTYDRGMAYFLEQVPARRVYPMHFWGQPQVIDRFLEAYPQYRGQIMEVGI